jgi:hypothetical protein
MGIGGVELQGSFGILAKLWQDRDNVPVFGQFSANFRPIFGQFSANFRPLLGFWDRIAAFLRE